VNSQHFLRAFDCKYNKVASAMLTHMPLLEAVAEERKTTFISTGMSTYEDIDRAVAVFRKHDCPFVLLHCVSTYPSEESDLNMLVMAKLRERYDCPVGYSGHEVSTSPCVVAAALGASVIERHITLSRAMYGSDQSASLEFDALKRVVTMVRKVAVVMGDGEKRLIPAEKAVADKLRYW
jgi:N-acetylneuraminate synthase